MAQKAKPDPIGIRFGRLVVLSLHLKDEKARRYYLCQCDCGKTSTPSGSALSSGAAKSCGCLSIERFAALNRTHGLCKKSRAHKSWSHMKQRCLNPNNKKYPCYGARGISVCKRWMKFEEFYKDMGEPPVSHSLDRINVNGNYSKKNCKWSTNKEQGANKQDTIYISLDGQKRTLKQWCELYNKNYKHAWKKIKKEKINPKEFFKNE